MLLLERAVERLGTSKLALVPPEGLPIPNRLTLCNGKSPDQVVFFRGYGLRTAAGGVGQAGRFDLSRDLQSGAGKRPAKQAAAARSV